MQNRRSTDRTRVLRNAKIISGNRSLISCTLHNLSNEGACLELASTYRFPDTFELTFEAGRSRRKCRVIWRTATKLGITFERADESAAAEEAAPQEPVAASS